MVSRNKFGFGKFDKVPFNCANALPAEIVLRSTPFVSISAFGGSKGNLLYGIFGSNRLISFKCKLYTRFLYEGKNTKKITPVRGTDLKIILVLNQQYQQEMYLCNHLITFITSLQSSAYAFPSYTSGLVRVTT